MRHLTANNERYRHACQGDTGIMHFFRACLRTMTRSVNPLDQLSEYNLAGITSSMAERVWRTHPDSGNRLRQKTGIITFFMLNGKLTRGEV